MLIVKLFIFILAGILFLYVAGTGTAGLLRLRVNRLEAPCIGFLGFFSIIEAFGWLFVAYRLRTAFFACLVLCTAAALLIAGFRFLIAGKTDKDDKLMADVREKMSGRKRVSRSATDIILLLLVGAVVVLMIVLSEFYYRPDADDAFYVSNVALFSRSKILNPYDSSFGNPALGTVPMYDFQVYESVMAVMCQLLHVSATVMMHTYCLPLFLMISTSAYLFLGRTLGKGNFQDGCLYFLFLSISHLFGGYSGYSEGVFLLGRLWQGKTLCLTVLLPVLIAIVLQSETGKQGRYTLQLGLCALAGMAMNPTSSFLLGFQLLFMTVAVCVQKKSIKKLRSLSLFLIMEGFFLAMIYLCTSRYAGQIAASSTAGKSFISDTVTEFLTGHITLIFLFLGAAIIVTLFGNEEDRLYLVITPILMLIVLWNPWSGRFVAQHITTVPTYWRVFWLAPAAPAISRAAILLYRRSRLRMPARGCILMCAVILLAFPFQPTVNIQDRPFRQSQNWEKLAPAILILGNEMMSRKDRPVVLACRDFATTLRQEYTEMELIVSREQYIKDLFLYRGDAQEAEDRLWLDQAVNGLNCDFLEFSEKLAEKLEQYQVDFLIIKSNRHQLIHQLNRIGWGVVASTEAHALIQKVQ